MGGIEPSCELSSAYVKGVSSASKAVRWRLGETDNTSSSREDFLLGERFRRLLRGSCRLSMGLGMIPLASKKAVKPSEQRPTNVVNMVGTSRTITEKKDDVWLIVNETRAEDRCLWFHCLLAT